MDTELILNRKPLLSSPYRVARRSTPYARPRIVSSGVSVSKLEKGSRTSVGQQIGWKREDLRSVTVNRARRPWSSYSPGRTQVRW